VVRDKICNEMKSETRNAKQEIFNLFDTRLCMTMLTRSKYVFLGEATINLITTIISNRYFQFATMDATTTSIDAIEVIPSRTAVVVEAPKRYTWKFPIKPEQTVNTTTNELVKTFPFLDDRNIQDFLYARALIIHAPYTVTTGVQKAWDQFHRHVVELQDRNGEYPFLLMKQGTCRKRFNDYVSCLEKDWSDKCGAGIAMGDDGIDYDFHEDGILNNDDVDDGKNYAKKIRGYIEQVLDELKNFNEAALERDITEKEKEKLEAAQVATVRSAALGKLVQQSELFSTEAGPKSKKKSSIAKAPPRTSPVPAMMDIASSLDLVNDETREFNKLKEKQIEQRNKRKANEIQAAAENEATRIKAAAENEAARIAVAAAEARNEEARIKAAAANEAARIAVAAVEAANTKLSLEMQQQQMKLNAQMQTEMLNVLKELRGKQSSDK
jgi:hypothetical protein